VNVTQLMLARFSARDREMATRVALGAGAARIVRQLLTESMVLALAGWAGGLLLGWLGLALLAWARPAHLPRQSEIAIDATVALAALGLSLVVTVASAIMPALRFASTGAPGTVGAMRSIVTPRRQRRWQRTLVAAEVALSIVPLVAAGLVLRSFVAMAGVPLGFEPAGVLTAQVGMSTRLFPDVSARWALLQEAVAEVARLPGVESVGGASPLPFEAGQLVGRFRRDDDPDLDVAATQQSILPGYLATVGIPIVRGRPFTGDDIATRNDVAIVDERFARALWPEAPTVVGRRFRIGSGARLRVLEVVGVTPPVRVTRVRDESRPHVFVPYHVFPVEMSLVVKASGDVAVLGPAIKRSVEAIGTQRAVHGIRPLEAYVADSRQEERFLLVALTVFAGGSLLLAIVGLYGTLAYLTAQRLPEFGLRVALGSTTARILALVAREGVMLVGIGVVAGGAGAMLAARSLSGLLYGVTPLDPLTLAGVAGLVAAAAALAVAQPAWRAARVDPTIALRSE
jgi:putative ABC transport system permease protein